MPSCHTSGPGDALDGCLNAVVRHASTERPRHAFADLRVGRMRVPVEQRLGGHDLAVLTEAALRNLFVNPGLLQRVELSAGADPLEGRDLGANVRDRSDAGPGGHAVDDDGARATLSEAAAE